MRCGVGSGLASGTGSDRGGCGARSRLRGRRQALRRAAARLGGLHLGQLTQRPPRLVEDVDQRLGLTLEALDTEPQGFRQGADALRSIDDLLDPPADVDHDLLEISRRGLGLLGLGGGLVTERRFDDS